MRLRPTRPATRQLDVVLGSIARHDPSGARRVQARLRAVMHLLLRYPHAGQATARRGVRRMVAAPYPYAVTYRVENDAVVVLGVRHTARRPIA